MTLFLTYTTEGPVLKHRHKKEEDRERPDTLLPKDWKSFLHVSSNKTALFSNLADEANMSIPDEKDLVLTRGSQVVSLNSSFDKSKLEPCNHEETDTLIFLHCKDVYSKGHRKILITANDTDFVVLGLSFCSMYRDCFLWRRFGQGNLKRLISLHEIVGYERCLGLPFSMRSQVVIRSRVLAALERRKRGKHGILPRYNIVVL